MATYLKLLGIPAIKYQEAWHHLPATKASALLFYLAYMGNWVDRGNLVYLFWPDTTEQTARRRLSRILIELKKLPFAEDIEAEPTRLRWQVKTDVQDFVAATNEGRLSEAVQLYGGTLLETFNPPNTPEFESWLELEHQALHGIWKNAVLTLASDFESKEQYSQAAEVLERLHKAESFDEMVFRRYLENLQHSHQQAKALEAFERFRRGLEQEFDSEPEQETLELIQAIRQGEVSSKTTTLTAAQLLMPATTTKAKPRHNLPVQPTQFVGRELEKARLAQYLTDSSCRLLSLVAPGGMGKTRLAIEVARSQLDYFAHGVWFASFVAVNAPEQMVYTVADALGISFFGQRDPKEQLVDYLADKELLLILDNLEHLLSGVGLIRDLLAVAPKLKILATSRERLNLQAEHVYDLEGLGVPDQRSNNATDFDSLQLFAERAKHSRHDFILDNNSIPAVTHICKLVEGMPLAIELAASWLRVLSISDIATEVEKGIGLLGSSARDLPSRHQSIRAVFDHSWQLLTQEEQVALRRLSVFQGGFRREAALEVADVSLPILASLTDKSLLTLTPSGRYRRHPLIIHYTQEKLAQVPEDKARAEENHGLYYLRFVQEKGKHLWGLQRKETLEAISEELTNVRAAWDWAVKVVRIEELKQSTFYLYDVYRILRPQEGLEVSGRAVEGLDENNPAHHAALGRLLVKHGTFQNDEGRHEEGGKAIRRGLDLLYRINDVDGILDGLGSLQRSARELGDYTESKKLGDEGLALARQYNKPGHISGWLVMLSNVVKDLEIMSLPEKFAFYEAGLKEVKALGDLYDLVGFIHLYAFFLLHHGQPQEAKRLQQDNLRLAREHSMVYEPGIIDCLAMAEYKLGNHQGAYALLQQAYTVGEKLKLAFFDGYVFGNLGKVARALGDHAKSKEYLKRSLEIGLETKSAFNMATTLVSFAELHMDQGQALQAAEWLSLSLHHPGTEMHGRIEAKRLLEQLHNQLPPKTLKAAIARGKTLDLSEVVRGILATL